MRFCKGCGKTLDILHDPLADTCTACRAKSTIQSSPPSPIQQVNPDTINAWLSVEDDKIVLKSEEGWLLWSGDTASSHHLSSIQERAAKILSIRKRKKAPGNSSKN